MPALAMLPALLRSRWLHLAVLALALAFAWVRGNHYRADRDHWKAAFTAQRAAYEAAEQAAASKAIAARAAAENQSAELARKADHAETIVADLRAGADRFAAAHRMRPAPACSASSGAATPAPDGPAPDRDGPGSDAVVLTRPEYDQFVANSIRLEQVRQWGESLIQAGSAIPEIEFGKEPK